MKPSEIPWRGIALFVFLVACGIFLAGCQTGYKKSSVKPVDTTPTISAQAKKDAVILGRAEQIDEAVKPAPAPIPQVVKESTDAIRAAVKAAPAEDVAALTKSLEKRINETESQLLKANERADKAEAKGNLAIRMLLFSISSLVTIAGVVIAFTGSQIPLFGPRAGFAVACGGGAGFALAVAYDWSVRHPVWTGCIIVTFIAISLGIMWANHVNSKQDALK